MIKRIKFKDENFGFDISDFLYPFLVKFVMRHEATVRWQKETIEINSYPDLKALNKLLIEVLFELLDEFYVEPDHKKRSKNPSRYIKIIVKEKKYALDYRTNLLGKIVFRIYDLHQWVNERLPPPAT